MNFEYSKYILKPLAIVGAMTSLKNREGAIIKVTWPNGKFGYADLMPKPETGDPTLGEELANLKNFQLSPLVEQTIALAKRDAKLRDEKKNAFKGAKRVKNNYFLVENLSNVTSVLLEQIKSQNYSSIKIDCGKDFEKECDIIRRILKLSNFLLRLDFNAKADFSTFERFVTNIEIGLRPRIEFILDPMPYDFEAWKDATKLAAVGIDSQYNHVSWGDPKTVPQMKYLAIRPSRIDVDAAIERAQQYNFKILVTSSLEHPISIAHASLIASDIVTANTANTWDHDCLYHGFYAPNEFSGSIRSQGPYLLETDGAGIGFENHLPKMTWTALR